MEWTIEGNNADAELVGNKYSTLLRKASATYGKKYQRIQPPSRNEPPLESSEFHPFDKRYKRTELTKKLASSLDKTGKYVHISQKVKKVQKLSKPLPAPLERPEADKIKRVVAFDNVKLLLNRWEPIVITNKVTDQLSFPLNKPFFRMTPTKSFLHNIKAKTPLEQEVENILANSPICKKEKEEIPEKKTFFLNRKEIMEQRKELARIRAQQSYREAKARRQNKIKSKKYHRVLRRENTKRQLREFEELQKIDPEAALKKLEELEKTRAEERVTLRHRSTGQWARNKAVHAKYDKDSRQLLAQQLRLSKDLTQKADFKNGSDDEDVAENDSELPFQEKNPWMQKPTNEYEDFSANYRRFWDQQQLNRKTPVMSEDVSVSKRRTSSENDGSQSKEDGCGREVLNTSGIKDVTQSKYGFLISNVVEENADKCASLRRAPFKKSKFVNSGWKCTDTHPSELKNDSENLTVMKDMDDMFEDMEIFLKNKFEKKASLLKYDGKNHETKTKKLKSKRKNYVENKMSNVKEFMVSKPKNTDELLGAANGVNKEETSFNRIINSVNAAQSIGRLKPLVIKSSLGKDENIDPQNFIPIDKHNLIKTQVPDIAVADDDEEETSQNNLMTISEAFTEDDVVAEFCQEKEVNAEKDNPKNVDLTLPGWGEWAGKGLPKASKKKKRFILQAPKSLPRKDDKKESVIINESADLKARAHQVNELPFPYTGVESFEASIRAPLGSTWIPETAHRKLIAPKVTTLMGAVIEPVTEEVLVDQQEGGNLNEDDD